MEVVCGNGKTPEEALRALARAYNAWAEANPSAEVFGTAEPRVDVAWTAGPEPKPASAQAVMTFFYDDDPDGEGSFRRPREEDDA